MSEKVKEQKPKEKNLTEQFHKCMSSIIDTGLFNLTESFDICLYFITNRNKNNKFLEELQMLEIKKRE